MTILLVDSNKDSLDQEAERLTHQQFAVTISLHSSANEAIRFIICHEVDFVFTRDELVDMSGKELVKRIHSISSKVECYIIPQNEEIPFRRLFQKSPISSECEKLSPPYLGRSAETDEVSPAEKRVPAELDCSVQIKREEGDRSMTEQELRSLNRRELLEIMLEQGREMENNKAQYEKDLAFLKSEHEKDMEYLKTEYEKEITLLKKELEQVKASLQSSESALEQVKEALRSREIAIDEAGSIAMAALQLNGVFEAAQAASQQYIENIRSLSERQEAICAQRDAESKAEQERRLQETISKCAEMEYLSRKKCEEMEAESKQKTEAYWAEVSHRLQLFYDNHQELKKLLNFSVLSNPV